MAVKCINKNTTFYKSLEIQGFTSDEIAQITDKLDQEAFKNWYGKGELDSFSQPRLVKDLYLVNDKSEQITLNDLLNDKYYEKRQNYSKDLTYLDKINQFLQESKVGITKRISAFHGTEYAKRLEKLLDDLNKLDENEYLEALEKHSEYILSTVTDFENKFYNYDKINVAKLTKEEKEKRDKNHKNALLQMNNFLYTFSKIKNLDSPVNRSVKEGEILRILKDIENRVTELQNRVNSETEANFRDTFGKLITNPEIKNGVVDFLAAQMDETYAQLKLDALGDSHVPILAALDKFYKKAMHEKDEEAKKLTNEWEEFIKSFNGNFDTFLNRVLEKKDGKRTGRFIQKYSDKYYEKLFEYVNKLNELRTTEGEKSQSYIDTLNQYYTWKKENTEQKYKKDYYDTLNLLTPIARQAKEKIDTMKSEILSKKNLKIEDYEKIEQLDREMKLLKSRFNPDGTKKEGEALEIANSLYKYSKEMSKYYETKGIAMASFNKAKKEAQEKGEEYFESWLKHNTSETYTDNFWNFFNNLVSKIPKSEELLKVEGEIKRLTNPYKNDKGELMVEDTPEEVLKELKNLELTKSLLKQKLNKTVPLDVRRKIASDFKKYIVFEPTTEYIKTLALKKEQLNNKEITQQQYNTWYSANHTEDLYTQQVEPNSIWRIMKPKDKKFITRVPNNRWKVTSIKDEFVNPNFSLDNNGYSNPNDNWINQEYKDLNSDDLEKLNYIQEKLLYLTEHTKGDIIKSGYLPAIPKDNRTALEILRNKQLPKGEDNQLKAITETDEIVKFIPFKYVKKLSQETTKSIPVNASKEEIERIEKENEAIRKTNRDKHSEVLDYDLANTMKTFIKVALTNKYKSEIELDIKLFKEQLKHQKIKRTNSKGKQIYDKIKTKVTNSVSDYETSAVGSNTEKHFNEWLEGVFYEDFELDEGFLSDWTSKIQNFTSLRALGFNVLSGVNNKLIGNIQERIESAGRTYFSYKDYTKARKDYASSLIHIVANHKDKKSNNKVDAYIKYFDILVSQDELSNRPDGLVKTLLHKAATIKNTAYFMQHIGEHQVQNATLLAMCNSHKIVNGKIINFNEFFESKEIKVNYNKKMTQKELDEAYKDIERNYELKKALQNEFTKYPSLFESFEIKKGELSLKEDVKLDKDEIFNFKQRVIGVNQRLHGIYNTEDAGTAQRYALGRLAMQFRKWMRPGWNKRFGSKFGKKIYNERIRDYEEGMYISTFNFIFDPFISNFKEFRKEEQKTASKVFKMILDSFKELIMDAKIRWHSMDEIQRANIRKTGVEFLFLLSVIAIGFLAKKLKGDDDDDEKGLIFTLYQADRLFGELTTFTPVGVVREGNRLFNSPSPVFNTFEDIFKLGTNMFLYPFRDEEGRVFKSGIYHGQDKVKIYSKDMIPVLNQFQRLEYMNENNQRYGMFK